MGLSGDFKSQFRYWFGHALFCATPSFILAIAGGLSSVLAIAGIVAAIIVFISVYAGITSSRYFRQNVATTLIGRSIKIGATLRSAFAGFGLLAGVVSTVFVHQGSGAAPFLVLPDMMCGLVSVEFVEYITGWSGIRLGQLNSVKSFSYTLLTTICDGVLLSATLLVLILATYTVLAFRHRTKRPAAALGR